MHWALGKEEMARRAYERNTQSEQSGSSEEIAKVKPNSTCNVAGTQQFEDYRVHHFNATRPPQVQLPVPVTPQRALAAAWIPEVSNVDLDRSASSIVGENGEVNLVAEAKRQVSPTVLCPIRYMAVNGLLVTAGTSCRRQTTLEDDCSRQPSQSVGELSTIDIRIPSSLYQRVSSL